MKILGLLLLFTALSCSGPSQVGIQESSLKEALLRTRSIYTADRNIDAQNPLEINFYTDFSEQLVEINLDAKPMNTFGLSIVNSDLISKSRRSSPPSIEIGTLKIEFDGSDITPCLIEECNSTNCTGSVDPILDFAGTFNTRKIFLNLTKMKESENPSCASIDFNEGEVHRLTFKEIHSPVGGTLYGGRLIAQVITYNRTFRPQHIQNVFQ